MLGRFRMTVPDCLHEYESLGGEIFGKPRFFCQIRFGLGNRTKYDGARLRKVFEDVTARRSAQNDSRITFPFKRGLCKTSVKVSISYILPVGGIPYASTMSFLSSGFFCEECLTWETDP
jgi:hypothetical protein